MRVLFCVPIPLVTATDMTSLISLTCEKPEAEGAGIWLEGGLDEQPVDWWGPLPHTTDHTDSHSVYQTLLLASIREIIIIQF